MPRPKTLVHLQIRINNILRAAAGRLTKPPENVSRSRPAPGRGADRRKTSLLQVLHLNFEFAAKCLSQHQNVLVSRQKPHTAPRR
jgi:hypothetical protein